MSGLNLIPILYECTLHILKSQKYSKSKFSLLPLIKFNNRINQNSMIEELICSNICFYYFSHHGTDEQQFTFERK